MKLSPQLFAAAAAIAVRAFVPAPEALAQTQMTGNVSFRGAVTLDSQNLATATRVDSWSDTEIASGTGPFAGVPYGTPVTFLGPWNFNSGPILNFWSFNSAGGNF